MKVAVFSKADAAGGGAGRMAQNIATWLEEDGHSVVHYAAWGGRPFGSSFRSAYGRAVRFAKRVEARVLMNEALPLEVGAVLRHLNRLRPDVVHFHDLTTAFSVDTVRIVARRWPTVWTLHDQAAMTGGCITAHPCTRYLHGCGACPRFPNWCLQGRTDLTAHAQRRRRSLFRTGRSELTTPSKASAVRLIESGVLEGRTDVHVVPNGMDLRSFRAVEKETARRWLGLPADRFIVLLIAYDLDDTLKNPPSQRSALAAIADLEPFIVTMGRTTANPGALFAPNDVKHLGFITNDALKNTVFAAADVYVNTSLGDTFSLTTLEALASGVPVIAYASGGIPEIVEHRSCGLLVPPDDGQALEAALREVITSDRAAGWRAPARARAERFGHRQVVDNYLGVYEHAITRFSA